MPRSHLPTALVHSPEYLNHDTGRGHPERPERYSAVMNALSREKLLDRLLQLAPRKATDAEILACHTAAYLETARRDVNSGAGTLSTGDTQVCAASFDVALLAAGGVLNAVDAVISGTAANAFCVVRPPGHHATPSRGMGFCLFDNVAIAARYAQSKYGIGRVLIADWDVHHGNGTQDIFYADPTVFFFSTHQWPLYPGTGAATETGVGAGAGFTLNCLFPAGSGRDEILGAFKDKLVPAMERFKPEMVFISAGFDSRIDDPLGRFTLSDADFGDLTCIMLDVAGRHSSGRLVSVLEGGYNLDGLGRAAATHVAALMG
jgi:acetoin utilization deacetylase AcuC-like enzyme